MGLLRLFLAVSVVVGHTGLLFGLHLLPGNEAVRIFFMISGFYMALILTDRYAGRPGLFYSNRLLRLYPAYWIALLLAAGLGLWNATDSNFTLLTELNQHLHGQPSSLNPAGLAAAIFANVTLVGSDLLWLFHHGPMGWEFTFGNGRLSDDPGAMRAGVYQIVSQGWSIGLELWFYAMAPLLVRQRMPVIAALAIASLAGQLWLDHLLPWASYFFFPANLCFFLFGVMAFRLGRRWSGLVSAYALPVTAVALTLLIAREFLPLFRNYSWMHYSVAAVAIPFLFEATRNSRLDRWVGDLSYPTYLLHLAAMEVTTAMLGDYRHPVVVLAITLPAALAMMVLLERPLDRWRAMRVTKPPVEPASTLGLAKAA